MLNCRPFDPNRSLAMRLSTAFACLWLLAPAALAQAPDPALPADVARLRGTLRAELSKQAEAYNASLRPLAENYVLDLKRLSTRLKEGKDAAGVEAVRKEAARYMQALAAEPDPFETVPELTQESVNAAVEPLRLVQEEYAARRTLADGARSEKARGLAEKYAAALDQLQSRYAADEQAQAAAAAKKEATRVRVVLQRKDAASRLFEEAGARCLLMPPAPDVANLKERAEAPAPAARNLTALTLDDLPATAQAFLMRPFVYDKDWPPEITKWKFEGTGNYSHDFSLYNLAGLPDELGIFAYPKTMRAYLRGTKRAGTANFDGKAVTWLGKAMAWRLNDSRDLVCKVVFTTRRPALKPESGPAACVAVYSIGENNRLIASMSVPMLTEATEIRMAKHFSYNRMNIVWEGSKRKRGFTIPDHMPMRVVAGVACFAPGEEAEATIEVVACGPLGDMW
jgi:hypothetical protein